MGSLRTVSKTWGPEGLLWQSNMGSLRTALAVKHGVQKDCYGSQTWGPEGQFWQSHMGSGLLCQSNMRSLRTALAVKHGILKDCTGSQTWGPEGLLWQSNMGPRRVALAVKHGVLMDCSGSQTWGPEGLLWQSNTSIPVGLKGKGWGVLVVRPHPACIHVCACVHVSDLERGKLPWENSRS